MEKNYKAILVDRKEVAADTYEITIEIPVRSFSFTPGQYIWIILDDFKYPDKRGNRRAFSIVSKFQGKDNQIHCLFRKSDSGFKKSLMGMPIGSAIRIEGPFGFCTLPQDETVPTVFLAGGVGISSVFTMIGHATVNKSPRKIILIYANSNLKRAPYIKELENFQRENKNFILVQHIGELNREIILNNTKDLVNPTWYIFGPKFMIYELAKMLIKNNIPLHNIKTEEFGLFAPIFDVEHHRSESDHLRLALDNSSYHIVLADSNGTIVYANHGTEIITGFSIEEILGNTPRLWGGLMDNNFYKSLWKTIKENGKTFAGEVKNRRKNGNVYFARIKISPFFDPKNNRLLGFSAVEEDITKEKEIEKIRMDFLSFASHQLRTPLSGTKWMIETMQKGILGDLTKKQKEYLDDIYRVNEQMIRLVSDMLSTLRLESEEIFTKKENISIASLFKDILTTLAAMAKINGVSLQYPPDHRTLTIETDSEILKSILECLLSNAINYSEHGKEVILDIKEEATAVTFFVKDRGIGIPKDEQKYIFEKFYRASNAKEVRPSGTGLGLYIASTLAEKIGAKISFESEVGSGSTFFFRVPK